MADFKKENYLKLKCKEKKLLFLPHFVFVLFFCCEKENGKIKERD
jgi:hypothetical protein